MLDGKGDDFINQSHKDLNPTFSYSPERGAIAATVIELSSARIGESGSTRRWGSNDVVVNAQAASGKSLRIRMACGASAAGGAREVLLE